LIRERIRTDKPKPKKQDDEQKEIDRENKHEQFR